MQVADMNVLEVQEFVQQLEDVKGFVNKTTDATESLSSSISTTAKVHFQQWQGNTQVKSINDCQFCGWSHIVRKCPAYWEILLIMWKSKSLCLCKSSTKTIHSSSDEPMQETFFTYPEIPMRRKAYSLMTTK